MRILLLADLSSYHTYLFAETLSEKGHEVHVASAEPPLQTTNSFEIHQVKPLVERKNFLRYLPLIPRFKKIVRELNPDIIHAHFISNYGLIARFIEGRKILSVWGSDLLVVPSKSIIHRKLTEWILKGFDLIHVDAIFMKEILKGWGIPGEKVRIFLFGLKKDMRDLPLTIQKQNLFVTHRRLDPDMDPLTIVRAFKQFHKRYPDAELIMMSDGSLKQEIENVIDKDTFIKLTGRVSRETLIKNLINARFYLSASLTDSTSVSLLEAMAAGCFPIVTDLPGNREWVEPGKNGLLFEPGNAGELAEKMIFAVTHPELVDEAIRYNKSLIQKRANFEENVKKLYEEL